tara:strand:+ start:1586 stop:1858 length:273 start_codon:yes stop_codon:yes gene_type:complete
MEHISKTFANYKARIEDDQFINKVHNKEKLSDAIVDLSCTPNDLNSISQQLDDLYYQATKIQHTITLINKELIRVISKIKSDSEQAEYNL